MKATRQGRLQSIPECKIIIPAAGFTTQTIINPLTGNPSTQINPTGGEIEIILNNLPDISDSKSAVYNGEGIIGRASPIHTYSHSAERTISMQLHFFIVEPNDGLKNLQYLRAIQSAVYPRRGDTGGELLPYRPPPVCRIRCGKLLGDEDLCVILQSYSVKFPTEVAWDEKTYCPYRFDVDTSWVVTYTTVDLPFQDRIVQSGR